MYEEYKNIFGATNFPKPRLNSDLALNIDLLATPT